MRESLCVRVLEVGNKKDSRAQAHVDIGDTTLQISCIRVGVTVAFFPPAAFNRFVTAGDGPNPKDAKCGTLPQTGALLVDT